MACEYGYRIKEWENRGQSMDHDSNQLSVTQFLQSSYLKQNLKFQNNIQETKFLLLIDDLPNVSDAVSRDTFHSAILEYLTRPYGWPLVILSNDEYRSFLVTGPIVQSKSFSQILYHDQTNT